MKGFLDVEYLRSWFNCMRLQEEGSSRGLHWQVSNVHEAVRWVANIVKFSFFNQLDEYVIMALVYQMHKDIE